MKGRRVYPNPDGSMPPMREGDYGCFNGVWWGFAPGAFLGSFEDHEVLEHEDGSISVVPSIEAERDDPLLQFEGQHFRLARGPVFWHGYLERGEWRQTK